MKYLRKLVKGYEGYEIDTDGNIWSYKWGYWVKRQLSNRGGRNQDYLTIMLTKDGKQKNFSLHRLLAEHFIPNPKKCTFVCHKDGNPLNNSIENLYWGTALQNQHDRLKHGTDILGEKNVRSKLNDKQVRVIKHALNIGTPQGVLAMMCDVTDGAINHIKTGLTWSHINI